MNLLDIFIAIPLIFFIYKGWKRGLIFELAMLCGIIIGGWAATHLSQGVANLLNLEGESALLIAFFIIFVGVIFLAFFLSKAIEGIIKIVKVGKVNNILGAAFGMLKCLCIISILLNFIILIDRNEIILTHNAKNESAFFEPTYKVGNKITSHLKANVEKMRQKTKQGESGNKSAQ